MTEPPDVEHSAVAQAGPTLVQIAGRVLNRPLQRDNQDENPASIRMRTRVWGHVGRA